MCIARPRGNGLLTHSFSGKALAVRRVTTNRGKNTPGVDNVVWKTPEAKTNAIAELGVAALQFNDHRNEFCGWTFGIGFAATGRGGKEKAVLAIDQGVVELE